jgi:hypothetical protein
MAGTISDLPSATGGNFQLDFACSTGVNRLLIAFGEAVDRRRPADVAQLFTDTGLFRPGETELRGRVAIETFYADRLTDERRVTHHVWNNVQIHRLSAGEARVSALLANYAFEPAVTETDMQLRMGHVDALCMMTETGEWHFAEHLYRRGFAAAMSLTGAPPVRKPE